MKRCGKKFRTRGTWRGVTGCMLHEFKRLRIRVCDEEAWKVWEVVLDETMSGWCALVQDVGPDHSLRGRVHGGHTYRSIVRTAPGRPPRTRRLRATIGGGSARPPASCVGAGRRTTRRRRRGAACATRVGARLLDAAHALKPGRLAFLLRLAFPLRDVCLQWLRHAHVQALAMPRGTPQQQQPCPRLRWTQEECHATCAEAGVSSAFGRAP